jgi:dUTP pyrophosphatase
MTIDTLKSASHRVRWMKIDASSPAGLHAPKRHGDVGWDLEAAEDTAIAPGQAVDVPTNVRLHLPNGTWAEIRARSSIARRGLQVDAGTIDTGYRGPLFALVRNMKTLQPNDVMDRTIVNVQHLRRWTEENTILIRAGERVAQVVYHRCYPTWAEEVEAIDESSERGSDGFGSTGT